MLRNDYLTKMLNTVIIYKNIIILAQMHNNIQLYPVSINNILFIKLSLYLLLFIILLNLSMLGLN